MRSRARNRLAILFTFVVLAGLFTVPARSFHPAAEAPSGPLGFSPASVTMQTVEVAGEFEKPVHVTHAGDGSNRLFVSGQAGVVWIVENGERRADPFLDISDIVRDEDGEQGFFSIEFHPNYQENGYFYAVYTDQPNGDNILARFSVSPDDPNRAEAGSLQELIRIPDRLANHNGGDIGFGADGYLYYGTGDEGGRGDPRDNAQDPQSLFGKMLRIDVDNGDGYAIPADNPFVDDPSVLDEIWATGLRNPWRFSFDRQTGDLYIGDVGQDSWEEIDVEPAGSSGGLNYGWPIAEGFDCYPADVTDCDMSGLTPPVLVYSHEGEPGEREGCSVTGGEVYRGQDYPFMDGVYIFADWCEGRIWAGYQDPIDGWEKTELLDTFINWTSIGSDEQGELYGTDLIGGRLFRFTFSQANVPSISTITPDRVDIGQDTTELTITGSGFNESTEALLDGSPVPTAFDGPEQVRASVAGVFFTMPGSFAVTVRNGPEGGQSNAIILTVGDATFGDPAFEAVWSRTDRLVADGTVARTWIWGPEPFVQAQMEAYDESPGGERLVLYFDKSRMEITNPGADATSIWYVTNGLLVVEMMTGNVQVGDDSFIQDVPAQVNVAGDANDPNGVTYATMSGLRAEPPAAEGATLIAVLSPTGQVTDDPALAAMGVLAGPISTETGHRTAAVFWDFMTSTGPVLVGETTQEALLFENPYFATGFPVTEAYWTTVQVAGVEQLVLLQCFERRCLTYTPSNAPGWQVEAGNVGLHYYSWRYGQ